MGHALKKSDHGLTAAEYLDWERLQPFRHECIDGAIYAMSGASANHGRIVQNCARLLGNHLQNSPCEPFSSDMKLRVNDNFYYPDLLVTCAGDNPDDYYRTQPILLIEVLSPSTRRHDKGHKRMIYQSIPSLREFLFIEQTLVEIELCRRHGEHWSCQNLFLDDSLTLESVGLTVSVAELYQRVHNSDLPLSPIPPELPTA